MTSGCFLAGLIACALPEPGPPRVIAATEHVEASARGLEIDVRTVAERSSGRQLHELHGSFAGVPLARPIERRWVDASGRVLVSSRAAAIPPPNAVVPRLTSTEALARVRALRAPGTSGPARPELVLVPEARISRLVWRIDPPLDRANLTDPVFLVDALTGEVRVAYDEVHSASVRAYSPNPVVSPQAEVFELVEIDPGATNLIGPSWRALNCVEPASDGACLPQAVATADAQGDFLFPAPDITDPARATAPADPFAEAAAYYHADRFGAHLRALGLPGIPCQESGQVPTIVTNYGEYSDGAFVPFEDAAYTGQCDFTIAVGQGPTLDLALEGDILYHEIGHGVIAQAIGPSAFLGMPRFRPEALAGDAGAIGEAVADFLSSSFTGDPYVGEYMRDYGVLVAGRDNANDFTCPRSLMGKVHEDGEPFAAALWASYESLGDDFILVVVDAVAMFPDDVGFEEASEILTAVTGADLGAAAAATVAEELAARGLTDCERIVPWSEIERGMYLFPPGLVGVYSPIRPPPYQVEIDVPAGVDTVTLSFALEDFLFQGGRPDATVGLLQKAGTPITFEYEQGASGVNVTYDADVEVGDLEAGTVQLAVSEGKVYVAFANVGTTTVILTDLEVAIEPAGGGSSTGGTEGGTADDTTGGTITGIDSTGAATADDAHATTTGEASDGGGGGCACSAGDGRGSSPWLVLLGLPGARRRRGGRGIVRSP
jgi:hypothetical protein